MMYVSVLLPLALPRVLTYILPESFEGRVSVGYRVVVPLGARKFYAGIVTELLPVNPEPSLSLKEVSDVVDERPVILAQQLEFWRWMAYYYLCTLGEVMKAALPAGLKLESQTTLIRNANFDVDITEALTDKEWKVLQSFSSGKRISFAELRRDLGSRGFASSIRSLVERGALQVRERLEDSFKPRIETHVRLAPKYFSESSLNNLLSSLRRAPCQERLLTYYLDLSGTSTALRLDNFNLLKEVSKRSLLAVFPGGEAAFSSLRKKGIFETYPYATCRIKSVPAINLPQKPLSDEQTRALRQIHEAFDKAKICLLHGVTSSGKTEVYIRLIREALSEGRQVLYLLPEIALTTQITDRLGRVFGDEMGVYHSKFPDAERVEFWLRQLSSKPFSLILGVRSSLFLPFKNLGLVIVDEEHETSYKQQDPAPRYNARDAAILLATQCHANVLLGTATPSLETYRNALQGKYALVEMHHRFGQVAMPKIHVEDLKELHRKKLLSCLLSPRLLDKISQALKNNEQVILFHNRRGFSPMIQCRTCGWTPKCTRCDVSLTFHKHIHKLVCHYCGATYQLPSQCPNCMDTELRNQGVGTEQIEEILHNRFPKARISRMDLDTTRSKGAHERIIENFQAHQTDILIGTQMVTKGLDFEGVHVVGILNADQMVNLPDFRAHERAFAMMSQVAGRAGRRTNQGLVILQTHQPTLPVIKHVVESDYKGMYEEQMEERILFAYPPACRLIEIYLKHRHAQMVDLAAETLSSLLKPHFSDNLLGPDAPPIAMVNSMHIRKFLLKIPSTLSPKSLRTTLLVAKDILLSQPHMQSLTLYFNVDPL